jgi:hypothetical protein
MILLSFFLFLVLANVKVKSSDIYFTDSKFSEEFDFKKMIRIIVGLLILTYSVFAVVIFVKGVE